MYFASLEDKCQYYRSLTDYKILPNSNIIVMVDGKNFSELIKNKFKKPFDDDFINMMNATAKFLCENIQGCKIAYAQSDEISLLITDYDTEKTDLFFSGRLCKLQSIIASLATSEFNKWFTIYNLNKCYDNVNVGEFISKMKMAQFDCKAWVVPNENDAYAWFLYRQIDCVRNSKQQAAQTWCSHKELMNLNTDKQIEYLKEKHNIDWNDFSDDKKYGRFIAKKESIQKKKIEKKDGSVEEITFNRNKFDVYNAFPLFEDSLCKEKFFKLWK